MPLFKQEKQAIPSSIKEQFAWTPFSILNTTCAEWLQRRHVWETVIEDSTLGRDVKRCNATPTNIFSSWGKEAKQPVSISTFDPFLCELMYRWFSRPGDSILDPFAGGNVRGLTAAILDRKYAGLDLSIDQVDANWLAYDKAREKYTNINGSAYWLNIDAEEMDVHFRENSFDMVFTCPPYYNLEVYTEDSRDLSRQKTYEDFLNKYTKILQKSAALLKDNSFMVIVVSEIRASSDMGNSQYLGFVPDTIKILMDKCNLKYYNEMILMNSMGSLAVRAPKIFKRSRKIGRHHQNVLVFYKGNISNIECKYNAF